MIQNIIELNNISYTYPNGDTALNGINLEIPIGKKIALLGGNGAGKSTLMLLLNGILKPTKGDLSFKNVAYSYKKKGLRELRSKIGLLFPEPDYQLIAPSVYEEISFGLLNKFKDVEIVRAKAEKVIIDFSLESIINKPPYQLSTGQKKRVCLASVLAMEPELIVCDEPASNLDPMYSKLIFNYLDTLHKKGKTILISTHDVNRAYFWADYVIIMDKGEILEKGVPDTIFEDKELLKKANLNQPFIIDFLNKFGDEFIGTFKEISMLKKHYKKTFI
ncbi:cobalt/nickel transport system ATP-binding protein [Lutibacter agarilyticus]|uniref:Cobalt/nickel transport system ATP-binding protein n=1 Tax=Lutibacter agarilyticus TaxID=1109740 RepID=A0A238WZ06_9FLAO|nr:ABC transporter ATP-binding protein [Lutibacter agarilyticus]SNR51454.1 cobalt/nickel transport system ATP-binding protein [Lutibacter agarilyticus]